MIRHILNSWVIPLLGVIVYRLLALTWRRQIIETVELKNALSSGRPVVLAHWHGDELGLLSLARRYRICAMVSTSKDGEIMNRVVQLMGGTTSRGSSTRGGTTALRGLLRNVRNGFRPSVAVDGPKGPLHQIKPGIFEVSKLLGAEIHPIAIEASSAWVFKKSWNKTFLPKPFAKVSFVWGAPLPALSKDDDPRDLRFKTGLEIQLHNAKRQASGLLIAAAPSPC
jgi:lysophospholipid acyltransferase (LPLAT)-like uncharacterized protein